jgi:hypothetical protein
MKPIEPNEMYEHLSQFLRSKGIDMKEGTYTRRIQKGCSLLTDAVNATQQGMKRAKTEIDKRLEQMRQVIHEKTAPKPTPKQSKPDPSPASNTKTQAQARRGSRKRNTAAKSGRKK